MTIYKSKRIVDGKLQWVIIDKDGNVVNRNPRKDELKCLELYVWTKRYHGCDYNENDKCDNIKSDGKRCSNNFHGKAFKKYLDGKPTDKWICSECYNETNYIVRHNKYLLGTYGTLDENKIEKIKFEYSDLQIKYYNDTNTCEACGRNILDNFHPCVGNEYGKFPGKWLCCNCYAKDYQKNNPNSSYNAKKSVGDRRTNNQFPTHSNAIGDIFQKLTCIWRSTISTIPVEDLNKKLDNFNSPLDHTQDSELGIIQTKGSSFNIKRKCWHFNTIKESNKEFDYEICYCISENKDIVERTYIIPKKEIIALGSLFIYRNPTTRWGYKIVPWYEQYIIKDEEINNKINNIWKEINMLKGENKHDKN
jgi:hypothetical protein